MGLFAIGFYKLIKKNNILFVILFLILNLLYSTALRGDCQSLYQGKLNELEKSYYGYTFSGTDESRLARIENAVYGQESKQAFKVRLDKLYKDLAVSINQHSNTIGVNEDSKKTIAQDIGPKADVGIKYPIVDKLEQQTFNNVYANEDIYNRLTRLEKQVFPNQNKSTLSLNERVDALRGKILGGTKVTTVDIDPMTEEIVLENGQRYYGDDTKSSFNIEDEDSTSNYNYYSYENSKHFVPDTQSQSFDNQDGTLAEKYAQSYDLDILEKNLLGQRYTSEIPSKRLARLETRVFQRTFADDESSRIQRLLAVTTAQKTSQEYDSNKWARRLNTGMQIGSILLMVLAMIL